MTAEPLELFSDRNVNLPFKEISFSYTIPGRICPNNMVIRRMLNRSVKNDRAREDDSRIREIIRNATKKAKWKKIGEGEAVSVHIICWNPIGDIDGRQKIIFDAMGDFSKVFPLTKKRMVVVDGHVYDDDKRIKKMIVEDLLDYEEPRFDVTVMTMPLPFRLPRARSLRFGDLNKEQRLMLISGQKGILDPQPGIVKPVLIESIPKSWIIRAKKEFL